MMRCWSINWADTGTVECIIDDGIDLEGVAHPDGVLLMDINDIATVQKQAQDEYEECFDEGEKPDDEWTLTEEKEGYRVYMFGDDLMMICVLKTIQ
jgi:hypothetical protein